MTRRPGLLLLAAAFLLVPKPGSSQVVKERPPAPDYDVRSTPTAGPTVAALTSEGELGQKLLAMAGSDGAPLQFALDRFGLPRLVTAPGGALTSAASGDAADLVRAYLSSNADVFSLTQDVAARLRIAVRQRVRGIETVSFHREHNGVPVFGGFVRAAVDAEGRILQIETGGAGPAPSVLNTDALTPQQAVLRGAALLDAGIPAAAALLGERGAGWLLFANPGGDGLAEVAVRLELFPLDPASARLVYRLFLDGERDSYEMLLDAASGDLLYRREISAAAGQARVWREHPDGGDRELVDLPDDWLAPGVTKTLGNNVDAHLDGDGDNEPDDLVADGIEGGRASSAAQLFDFPALEPDGNPSEFLASSTTNLFYHVNRAHDFFYNLGFTETASNFQEDNFGRGGEGGDPILAQAQDGATRFNARYIHRPEGVSPRIEMGLFDTRDSALDGSVVFHEYGHGVTIRVIGGPDVSCISGPQESAMGEGWSDYFETSFYDDPVAGEYLTGNTERGVRRFAYDNHPFTYEDLGNQGFEVHNDGEIWGATLWEVRQALGAEAADKLIYDGIRLTPCFPSFVDARDAILLADSGQNRRSLWEIFARRGMGAGASAAALGATRRTVYNANYDLPADLDTANRGPVILGTRVPGGAMNTIPTGEPWSYPIVAQDPEGDPLRYELVEGPEGMQVDAATGKVSWMPTFTGGRVKIDVVDDGGARSVHGFFARTFTELAPGAPLMIAGEQRSLGESAITIPSGVRLMQITLRGGSGDPDVIVFGPAPGFDVFFSFRDGADETLTLPNPAPGRWFVSVQGSDEYADVELRVEFLEPRAVALGETIENLAGALSSETFYRVSVPAGTAALRVTTGLGSGDLDVFGRFGAVPTCHAGPVVAPCEFDVVSGVNGNFEQIEIPEPEEGDWFFNMHGFEAYAGAELSISSEAPPPVELNAVTSAALASGSIAPGGLATLWGSGFAAEEASASSIPLPRELGGLRVVVGGLNAPLLFAGPDQINFQVPFEALVQILFTGSVDVRIYRRGSLSAAFDAPGELFAPAVFLYEREPGVLDPVITHVDGSLVTPDSPALPGEAVIVYLTGLGLIENQPPSGEAAGAEPLPASAAPASVTLGGSPAEALYTGLTPGSVGLAQVNIRVPENPPTGERLTLVITIGDGVSEPVELAVGTP